MCEIFMFMLLRYAICPICVYSDCDMFIILVLWLSTYSWMWYVYKERFFCEDKIVFFHFVNTCCYVINSPSSSACWGSGFSSVIQFQRLSLPEAGRIRSVRVPRENIYSCRINRQLVGIARSAHCPWRWLWW